MDGTYRRIREDGRPFTDGTRGRRSSKPRSPPIFITLTFFPSQVRCKLLTIVPSFTYYMIGSEAASRSLLRAGMRPWKHRRISDSERTGSNDNRDRSGKEKSMKGPIYKSRHRLSRQRSFSFSSFLFANILRALSQIASPIHQFPLNQSGHAPKKTVVVVPHYTFVGTDHMACGTWYAPSWLLTWRKTCIRIRAHSAAE